ncbi:hypothetical protein [Streptomyces asiaticus]|uniref:hypothetical protein n=1 Tax=Streptomyces asiaticus TaxID=114695 RepID=UPI003F66B3BA
MYIVLIARRLPTGRPGWLADPYGGMRYRTLEEVSVKRLLAGVLGSLSMAAVLAAGSLSLAGPAQATPADCEIFLKHHGYNVGPKVRAWCEFAKPGTGATKLGCKLQLQQIGVKGSDAETACGLSSK